MAEEAEKTPCKKFFQTGEFFKWDFHAYEDIAYLFL